MASFKLSLPVPSWRKGSEKGAEEHPADETALTASGRASEANASNASGGGQSADAQTPETSTQRNARDKETRANASGTTKALSVKAEGTPSREPAAQKETPSREPAAQKETPPPASVSPEDENKISKLRQISQMWKFRPIPPGPEASLERRSDALQCGNVRVTGASVRGKKHIHGGTDCDDWFEIGTEQEAGAVFIAVSDGAGSKKFSRIGAKASCKAAVESLQESFRCLALECPERLDALRASGGKRPDADAHSLLQKIVSRAMRKARDSLYNAFEKRISDPAYEDLRTFRDLSATLLLAVVIPSASGKHTVAACQVGDGALVLFDSAAPYERAMSILGTPDSGDYAGETEFMTSPSMTKEAFEKRVITRTLRFDSLLVMTDGVADDYFPAKPELFRLYFDLTANGVLTPKRAAPDATPIPLPAPLAFPNAGAEEECAPLNYVWLIESATKRSLEELWNDASPLEQAFRLLPPREGPDDSETRLACWLEHYVEAASFDDRTLVALRIEEGGESDGGKEAPSGKNGGKAVQTVQSA